MGPRRGRLHRLLARGGVLAALALAAALLASCGRTSSPQALGQGLGEAGVPAARIPEAAGATSAALAGAHPRKLAPRRETLFDATRVMADIRALTSLGIRAAGTDGEVRGAEWIARRLRDMGYSPRTEDFVLPSGKTSRNVFIVVPGTLDERVILGAHMDSKSPSPGANDDGSGVGILLEVARLLKASPPSRTVEIDFFGAEEVSDGNPEHHHAGSRYRASMLTAAERSSTVGMLSVDMASYGTSAYIRTMGVGPMTFANTAIAEGRRLGLPVSYRKDPGKSGWSDHEPFEVLGIPSAWLEWLDDPLYHTRGDTAARLSTRVVQQSGDLVLALLRR